MCSTESIHPYRPGGYHLVHFGEKFIDRYIVEDKLGHGGYSTVWLARDLQQDRLVALKIFVACALGNVDQMGQARSSEAKFLRCILNLRHRGGGGGNRYYNSDGELQTAIPLLIRIPAAHSFPSCSANSLSTVQTLVQAVAEFHGHGIVHRDLHPSNVVFCVLGVESWAVSDFRDWLGDPQVLSVSDIRAGYPDEWPSAPSPSSLSPHQPPKTRLPSTLSAPEVQLHDVLTPACDISSLGCLLHFLFSDRYMWKPMPGGRDTLLAFTLCYGKLPSYWWALWKDCKFYFTMEGALVTEQGVPIRYLDLESKVSAVHRMMDEVEYAWFYRLMLEIFKLDPKERMVWSEDVEKD
ncbi:kinase-like domain-containing protein [Trichophaea hybrida]|nr:kinase-like domain-containing protein [Trichophaea hybrida]